MDQMWRMRPCNLNDNNKLNLMNMPVEILVDILKRVPAKSVCCIRCVSKTLLGVVDNTPSFVTLHTRSLIGADPPHHHVQPSAPQLIIRSLRSYCDTNDERIMTLHSLNYDHANPQGAQLHVSHMLRTSKPLLPYTAHFVFCNLICIRQRYDDESGYIINPLQGEVLRLPPTHNIAGQVYSGRKFRVDCDWTGMGFDTTTNTYKILRVSVVEVKNNPAISCMVSHVLVLGTREWHRVLTTPPSPGLLHCSKSVCAFGDMHWLFYGYTRPGIEGSTHILSFDFSKEEFFWIPNPYILPLLTLELHFISFRGSMAIVDTTSGTCIQIWVMKDYNKKQWNLDYTIDIHMLELDPRFKFRWAVCGEWEHGILFINKEATTTLFLDLRTSPVTKRLVSRQIEGWCLDCRRIMSPIGSLISLKTYSNLVEGEEPTTYRNWTEGEASANNFFYFTM